MASVQLFLGGLLMGPVVAAQAGLAVYIAFTVIRIFGHWVGALLPRLPWRTWSILCTGYVFLGAMMLFAYSTSEGNPYRDPWRADFPAAMAGLAASFGVLLFLRLRGWRWFGGTGFPRSGHGSQTGQPAPQPFVNGPVPYADPYATGPYVAAPVNGATYGSQPVNGATGYGSPPVDGPGAYATPYAHGGAPYPDPYVGGHNPYDPFAGGSGGWAPPPDERPAAGGHRPPPQSSW